MADLFDLSGHHVLVTGASSGLGRHFAGTLARAGAKVSLAARREGALAQTVEQIGANVSRFAVGDRVFGSTGFKMGAHAEYVCVPENRGLVKTPDTVSDEQAAAIPFGGISALHFLRRAKIFNRRWNRPGIFIKCDGIELMHAGNFGLTNHAAPGPMWHSTHATRACGPCE